MGLKVVKFGGSSIANAEQFRKVKDIIAADPERRIVVVSAPGKRNSDDKKVTDLLIGCADLRLSQRDAGGEAALVVERYETIANELGLPGTIAQEFREDLFARLENDTENAARFEDSIKALGEVYCAKLMAAYLSGEGLPAAYVDPGEAGLTVTEEYGNARVKEISYSKLSAFRHAKDIVVFPGYFGYSENGNVATFSRGGSDLTGAILAASVGASLYENFTDVNGIAAADPRIVEKPAIIEELTYRELRELSYGGFSVFHDEAMLPVLEAGIPLNVRNTNNPSHPGTRVVVSSKLARGGVVGVACENGYAGIYVRKHLMNREKGLGRRLLGIFEEEDLLFDHMPTGVDTITVVLPEKQLSEKIVSNVTTRIYRELGAEEVNVERGLSLVIVVGERMRKSVGLAGRICTAISNAGINIEMLIQGPSELAMIIGISEKDAPNAVRAVYAEFFGGAQ